MGGADKLRIVFDASVLGYAQYGAAGRTGVFRVADSLARELAQSSECELTFCGAENFRMWTEAQNYLKSQVDLRGIRRVDHHAPATVFRAVGPLLWKLAERREVALPTKIVRKALGTVLAQLERRSTPLSPRALFGQQIYHSCFFALPDVTRRMSGLRRFLTVCDVINLRNPQFSHDGGNYLRSIIQSVGPEDFVIAISETTKKELCEYRPEISAARVFVVPLAASDWFRPAAETEISQVRARLGVGNRRYFLSVCTLDKRKNLPALVRAFALWVQSSQDAQTDLVLCGSLGDSTSQLQQEIRRSGLAPERIRMTGYVRDEDLAPLYGGALAFVYPSLHEGFGLPVLEAMRCGTPVITSDSGALAEVARGAAQGVNVRNDAAIAQALAKVSSDAGLRADLARRGTERAREFSWKHSLRALLAAYRAAL